MFDTVHFQSFKCLADLTLQLGRLTLLVGANASGKSSVLDGLHMLCQLGVVQPDENRRPHRAAALFSGRREPTRIRTWGTNGAVGIEGKRSGMVALAMTVEPREPRNSFVVEYVKGLHKIERMEFPASSGNAVAFFHALAEEGFGRAARLRLDATRIAAFAPDAKEPLVDVDGSGTAAVLAWLAEQRSPALNAIEDDLRCVVPRARRLLPNRAEEGVLGRVFSLEMAHGAPIPADLLSEGTLLTIGFLTVLHQQPAPRLVLLDDFDRALHPKAQRQLVECVKRMLERDPELQVVCTTHSPYVLDLFEADDVRVLRADSKGCTHAKKLTEHPEWQQWKDTMKAGEFWSYVGEDWLGEDSSGV